LRQLHVVQCARHGRQFIDGAEGQAKAIGAKLAGVFVRHPIQDRSDDEMVAVAEDAFPGVLRGLVADA
jgi:hypothetical protein